MVPLFFAYPRVISLENSISTNILAGFLQINYDFIVLKPLVDNDFVVYASALQII
ncbi:hypothetical protein MBAV_003592 [Candidatus Magnetobacterium bavaricum]|uniref:Uncharacterized protein n=1 Tax=Candidatus Magnetobacterium bavaricum TaxID=29290 RepID=A0A0F3GQM6_9BACT|nr:hypothetical protein MBAV_003592 [Candidatus Magnetobacterium bavaricum]